MKTEYNIVESNSAIKLTKIINNLLNEGWKLQGGISVENEIFYQAMVKEIEVSK